MKTSNIHKDDIRPNIKTYEARGYCTNCGRENYPQWGEYEVGKKIEEYPCPSCNCMTWVPDNRQRMGMTREEYYDKI